MSPFQNLEIQDLEGEIWKDMFEFEAYLQVSNLGRIKTKPREIVRIIGGKRVVHTLPESMRKQSLGKRKLKLINDTHQNLFFAIKVEGRYYNISVSRAVYSTFIRPLRRDLDFKVFISHKDGNRLNNCVDNLFENTAQDVSKRTIRLKRNKPPRLSPEKILESIEMRRKEVSQYDTDGKYICTYPSIAEASRRTGIDKAIIAHVCNRNLKRGGGYIWQAGKNTDNLSPSVLKAHTSIVENFGRKKVNQYDLNGVFIRSFESITEASKLTNIRMSGISGSCHKRLKKSAGYIWRFADE